MGFNRDSFQRLWKVIDLAGLDTTKCVAAEFGVQQSWFTSRSFPRRHHFKDVFRDRFKELYSFDLDPVPGVIVTDLSKPLDFKQVDILMDFGTAEHVGPTDKDSYQFWLNVHNITKAGGLMIHDLPEWGSWKNHCYWWYDDNFFNNLSKYSDYKITMFDRYRIPDQGFNVFCAMIKGDETFIDFKRFKGLLNYPLAGQIVNPIDKLSKETSEAEGTRDLL